jgi:hypothetical protein
MRSLALFLILVAFPVMAEDWTVAGKDYHNVKVTSVDPDCVHVTYEGGIGTFNFTDLTPDLRKRFGYDPDKAAIALKARQEKQADADKQIATESAQSNSASESQVDWSTARKSAVRLYGIVIQKVSGGYLIGTRATNPGYDNADHFGYYMSKDGNPTPANSFVPPFGSLTTLRDGLTIFLASDRDMVDDDRVDFLVYPSGEGSYETVLGAQSTVRKYAELPSVEQKDGKWVNR